MIHRRGDVFIIGTFLSFVKNLKEIFIYLIDKLNLYINLPTIYMAASFLIR
jgi:hypothetical protein